MSNTQLIMALIPQAILDTIWMVLASSLFAFILGLPLGLLLYSTSQGGLYQNQWINRPISALVDALRAIPFLILVTALTPITSAIIGRSIGNQAMIFVLSISSIPFYARMAELSLRGVDNNLVDAVRAMGATRLQTIREVVLPEALSSLVTGFTVTVIAIIAASSMAGFVGGEGLGKIAISYGYQRNNPAVMSTVLLALVILNIGVQWLGDKMTRKLNHQIAQKNKSTLI